MTPIFDEEADRWSGLYSSRRSTDRRYAIFQRAAQERARRRLILASRLLEAREGMRVLDVGCGSGPLRPLVTASGATWTGLDEAPAMVSRGRSEAGPDRESSSWTVGVARQLPFQEGTFDRIACIGVMNFIPLDGWKGVFQEFARVLRAPGAVIFTSLRLDALTWVRSRLYPRIPPPIAAPGPLFPAHPRRIRRILEGTPLHWEHSIPVSKYLGLPHYTMIRLVLS